jgi:hypothetical protein
LFVKYNISIVKEMAWDWVNPRRINKYEALGGMRIEPYGDNWYGLYDSEGNLICVCVYKRGCLEVMRRLHEMEQRLVEIKQMKGGFYDKVEEESR